jgi:hypothetical protein
MPARPALPVQLVAPLWRIERRTKPKQNPAKRWHWAPADTTEPLCQTQLVGGHRWAIPEGEPRAPKECLNCAFLAARHRGESPTPPSNRRRPRRRRPRS